MEVAVLTTRIPGASEVLIDGESCLLCEPHNETDLQTNMEALCDIHLAGKLATASRTYVEENYERSIMLKQQFEDYERL